MSKKPSITAHSAIMDSTKRIPELAMASVFAEKFTRAGVIEPDAAARAFARHILGGKSADTFDWDDGNNDISIVFDEEDIKRIEEKTGLLIKEMPALMEKTIIDLSVSVLERHEKEWAAFCRHEERQLAQFRLNIEHRWGPALDKLRVMHSMALSEGANYAKLLSRSRAKTGKVKRGVISQLHARSCQVVAEIITLLENGFTDGAMARWRILHEITTVAYIIEDGGDDVATRYLDHEIVDSKRALDTYLTVYSKLGYAEPMAEDVKETEDQFVAVKQKYGDDFATPFGWVAKFLNRRSPRFSDLEAASGRAQLRSHYKMASYNVHASAKALTFRIGTLKGTGGLIAGATNAGLEEAGQNTAFALAQINLLVTSRHRKVDEAIAHKCLVDLRDQAADAFVETARELDFEHEQIMGATDGQFGADELDYIL